MSSNRKHEELIEQLASICEELGWVIALPNQDELVPGLIIGTEPFVAEVISAYYGDDVEIFKKTLDGEGLETDHDFGKESVPELPTGINSKKTTFH